MRIDKVVQLPRVIFEIDGASKYLVRVPDGKTKDDLRDPYNSLTRNVQTGEPVRLHFRGFTADVVGRYIF